MISPGSACRDETPPSLFNRSGPEPSAFFRILEPRSPWPLRVSVNCGLGTAHFSLPRHKRATRSRLPVTASLLH